MVGLIIDSGVCYQIHTYRILEYTCLGTLLSVIQGLICFGMFGYILRQMQRNHRRALAGYTKNTINIDVHMNLMVSIALWYLVWGIINLFDSNDDADLVELEGLQYRRITGWSRGFIFGFSSFIEVAVLILLCSPSVGKNAFRVSGLLALAWGVVVFITIASVTIYQSGEVSNYFPYSNFVYALSARSFGTILINIFTLWFYGVRKTVTKRPAVIRFSNYLIILHCGLAISYMLMLANEYNTINIGLCTGDFTITYFFLTFAPRAYLALKRDCQYWSSDLGDEDDEDLTMNAQNETITWSELPNYKDVVIPKTELYFRSMLLDRIDSSVETHLWRRKIVIVKRFKFDFLTRDNIKFFKKEANIFKVLKHDNIVKFFGVVVDPPSLGIVMQFGVNGDLFKLLEKKRESYTEEDDKKNMTVRKSISLLRPYAVSSVDSDEEDVDSRHSEDSASVTSRSRSRNPNESATATTKRGESSSRRQSIAARMMSMTGLLSPSQHFGSSHFEPLYCALQVAYGMAYLHSQNVIHRDLKSLNVLLDEEFNALISDFGESAFDNIGGKTDRKSDPGYHGEPIGTAGWAAPEALKGSVTKASDVFSFGVLLWELVTWRAPAVLVPLEVLLEPPLCYVPAVLDALTQFRDAHASDSASARISDAPTNNGVELRDHLKSSDESSVSSRRKEIRLGQTNSMRDPLTNSSINSSRGYTVSNDVAGSMGNAFSAVFSKISYAPNPAIPPTAAEITRGISLNERLLIDVSDMTIAMELMYRRGYLPPLPIGVPQEIIDVMTKCWEREPANRPTFGQIVSDLDLLFRTMNGMPHLPAHVSCEYHCREPTVSISSSVDSGNRSHGVFDESNV